MELNDYQKGMIDALVGVFEMIFSEMDDEMINIIFKRVHLRKDE